MIEGLWLLHYTHLRYRTDFISQHNSTYTMFDFTHALFRDTTSRLDVGGVLHSGVIWKLRVDCVVEE